MEFRVLGPLEVWVDGRELQVAGAKQRALLAVLLLHANEIVSSERLVDVLWAAESLESGAAAMRVRISQLRKALPKDILVTRAPGYFLRVRRDELDLHRFEQLTEQGRRSLERGDARGASALLSEALALWSGPALDEFAYEEFAQAPINRLEELRLAAHELRIEADLAVGRHAELIAELEGLVATYPLREGLRAQLMLALYRAGRQAQALEVYGLGRRLLVAEIGIEPGPALRELERSILRHDPSLEPGQRTTARVSSVEADRSILVVALDPEAIDLLVKLAEPLARRPRRELILTRLLHEAADLGSTSSEVGRRAADLRERGVVARAATFTTSEPGADLVRLATEQDVDLVIIDAPGELLEGELPGRELSAVLTAVPCDVALVVFCDVSVDGPVLVPFSGAAHDWAAVELAAWVAAASELPLRLLGVMGDPGERRRDASRLLSHASLAIQRALGIIAEPILIEAGEAGILAAAADAGLLVLGLSDRWQREGLGPARIRLAREAPTTTVLVRRGLRPGGLAPRSSLTRFTWSVAATRG